MMRGVEIKGLGHYAPARRVPNAEIEARLGLEPGWIFRRTGIEARRYVADGEALSDIATAAGDMALANANIDRAERGACSTRDINAGPPVAAFGPAGRTPAWFDARRRYRHGGRVRRVYLRVDTGR